MLYRELFIKIFKYKRFYKFFISGSISAFVSIFSLFLLHGVFDLFIVLATSISFILAFLVNFSLQKFWTFSAGDSGRTKEQMLKHFTVGIFGLGVNAGGMYFLVEIMFVWYILAQAMLALALAFLNYFLYKIIFLKNDHKNKEAKSKNKVQKILIATGIYPPDLGGPATYSAVLKDELRKRGYEVRIVCYGEIEKTDKEEGIYRVSRAQGKLARYIYFFVNVWRLAKWADLVYVQGPVSEGLPSYFACRLRRKKYILKVVGDYAWEQGSQHNGVSELLDDFQNKNYCRKVEIMRLIEIFVSHGASRVIVPSKYLKNIVIGWGVNKEDVKVIYNSVEMGEFLGSKTEIRELLDLNGRIIMSASRLVPWKGFLKLIEVVSDLSERYPDIKLCIAGSGPDEEVLRGKIASLNASEYIVLLGSLEQKKLWSYIKASDLFILNTGYEGLSHLLIETMNLGTTIITTRAGGNEELIEHGINGILIDYNNKQDLRNAIEEILNNSEKAATYSLEAKKNMKKFSRKNMIDGLIMNINEL